MNKHKFPMTALLALLLLVSITVSILFGSVPVDLADLCRSLITRQADPTVHTLITTVRIPRALGGLFAGIGLSCSGVLLQTVMNNALASPATIGVNSGSGFGAMIAMMLFPHSIFFLPLSAFAGALLTSFAVFALAYATDSSRTTIILAGITISSFLNAGINTIKILDTELSVNLTSFLIGSLSGLTLKKLSLPCLIILAAFLLSCCFGRHLNILGLGDDVAYSLGLNVPLTRLFLLTLSSLLAGSVVSYAGLLSFVGLIVPHICRQLLGNDARILLPSSALLGGSFVLCCDLLGRILFRPFELPVGIIMAFVGGSFFLYLLLKKKGGRRVNA